MRLLIDEDCQAKALVAMLRDAGHDVMTLADEGMIGFNDISVLSHARRHNRVVLTRNASDFLVLHEEEPEHNGILAIYQDSDSSKSMSYKNIVSAISNIVNAGVDPTKQFIVLNAWRY